MGSLPDRLNVAGEADRRGLRLIGPGGYSSGQCYQAVAELLQRRSRACSRRRT